jgi:hypothetical protein
MLQRKGVILVFKLFFVVGCVGAFGKTSTADKEEA